MKTKIIAPWALTVALLSAALTGCGGDDGTETLPDPSQAGSEAPSAPEEPAEEPTEQATVTETVTPEPEPAVEDDPRAGLTQQQIDDLFLEQLETETPELYYGDTDALIIETARAVCDLFDRGGTWEEAVTAGLESGYDAYEVAVFLGTTIAAYCPEHEGILSGGEAGL